jgi:hypothetical protein
MVSLYRRPSWLYPLLDWGRDKEGARAAASRALESCCKPSGTEPPEVSLLVPVERITPLLLPALISLAEQENAPRTEWLLCGHSGVQPGFQALGLPLRFIRAPGGSQASQCALEQAKGRYVLCAQPDTFYPPGWVGAMTRLLQEGPERSCVFGSYRFLPSGRYAHWKLALYRYLSEPIQSFRAARHEYTNVMGFNMGFRRLDALRSGGFPDDQALDRRRARETAHGRLALRLSRFGKLHYTDEAETRVWTSAEDLEKEGGLARAFRRRVGRELARSIERHRRIVIE